MRNSTILFTKKLKNRLEVSKYTVAGTIRTVECLNKTARIYSLQIKDQTKIFNLLRMFESTTKTKDIFLSEHLQKY